MDNIDNEAKEILARVSANIRLFRESKGISREKFCEPLGVTSEYFSTIERENFDRSINLPLLLKICSVYNVSIEYFFPESIVKDDNFQEKEEINRLLEQCNKKQLAVIRRFISEIAKYI